MTDTTQEIKDIVAELNAIPATEDIPNSENWNKKAAQDDKKGDKEPETAKDRENPDRAAGPFYGALNRISTQFDLTRLTELQKETGKGLDLNLRFYKRDGKPSLKTLVFRGITVIAARTGGGKTFSLVSLAARVLRETKNHVVFISLEESELAISERLLSAYLFTGGPKKDAGNGENFGIDRQKAIPLDTIEAYINGETIETPEQFVELQRNGREQESTQGRIVTAAAELADRLTVIDVEAWEKAAKEYANEYGTPSADSQKTPKYKPESLLTRLEYSNTVQFIIEHFKAQHNGKVVFFIDYAQCLRDPEEAINKNAGEWKALQKIMRDLIAPARAGAVIYLAAQMNREGARDAKNDPVKEFAEVIPENIRLAADVEQAAEMIIYSTIDRRNTSAPYLNMKLLKYRKGDKEQAAAFPICWGANAIDLTVPVAPTLENKEAPKSNGTTDNATSQDKSDNKGRTTGSNALRFKPRS